MTGLEGRALTAPLAAALPASALWQALGPRPALPLGSEPVGLIRVDTSGPPPQLVRGGAVLRTCPAALIGPAALGRLMRLALSCAALLILALPGLGFAQDAPPGTVRVASRLFLAPDLPERYAEDEDFLPLTEMGWVQAIVEADPLLGPQGTVLHVTRLPSPPAWLFGEDGTPATLGNRDGVPEALRFEGLDAQTALGIPNPQTFNYRPEGAEPGFMLTCADPDPATGAFEFCGLLATYPPDPAISLKARFYHPEPFGALAPAVADRLRAIALCLDVTDAPPAYSEAALAALLAASPRLEGCEGAPTS